MELKEKLEKKIEQIKSLQKKVEEIDVELKKVNDKVAGEKQQILQEMLRLDGECRLIDEMIKEGENKT